MTPPEPACEHCKTAPAALIVSYSRKCAVVRVRLCEPCSRRLDLPAPFTADPLPRPK